MFVRILRRGAAALRHRLNARQGAATLAPPPPTPPDFDAQLAEAGFNRISWHRQMSEGTRRVYGHVEAPADCLLDARFEGPRNRLMAAAEDVLAHRFNLLGSGVYVPLDGNRAPDGDYQPIDWYLDPVRGARFPSGVPHREWDLFAMRPGNADIKYPWELARCQGWVNLGQAWLLSGQSRFALEIANQLRDFMQANPVGSGINWTCTMDVALRAVNWSIALGQVRDCPELDEAFWSEAWHALFSHGGFIRANLEDHYEVTSNHLLSNIVGLYFIGAQFEDLRAGKGWIEFAKRKLEHEITVQVCEDGSDFESSIPYHRLVTELFLGAAHLARHRDEPLSVDYECRLTRMIEFLSATLRPDGRMPQVGDADDGRLHVFGGVGHWDPQDARHLLGPARFHCDIPSLEDYFDDGALWEATWWGFDVSACAAKGCELPPARGLYPQAGVAVYREADTYLLVTNGRVGTAGFGNHKHNDQLSFEFHINGNPWIVDPGSYVYTSDFESRNAFRSVRAHNTLQLDDAEPNEFRKDWLFRMFEKANPEHLEYTVRPDQVQYVGLHHGYGCVKGGGTHFRVIRLRRDASALIVADRLCGDGPHELTWRLHLAPGVDVIVTAENMLELRTRGASMQLCGPDGASTEVLEDDWYSPSYGVRKPTTCVTFRKVQALGPQSSWSLAIYACGTDEGLITSQRKLLERHVVALQECAHESKQSLMKRDLPRSNYRSLLSRHNLVADFASKT